MSADRTNQQRTLEHTRPSTDDAPHIGQPCCTINADPRDQTMVSVYQTTWDFFTYVLAQPPDNPGLSKLMQAPTPWHQ